MKTDAEIQKDVIAELQWEPAIGSTEIGVSVKTGVVMLSGIVDSYYKKVLAEKAVKKVIGVNAVVEDLEVKLPDISKRNDVDIASAILHSLKWNSTVDETKIKVLVKNGAVTLEGETEWSFQKNSANKAVEKTIGVTDVINNIYVKTHIVAHDIEQNIKKAFHRIATIDSNMVNVGVIGDIVTLKGTVRSFAERQDAESTAWCTPGVSRVDNKLIIDSGVLMR